MTISRSTVTVVAAGANAVLSGGAGAAGLGCVGDANVTVQAVGLGSLSAAGGASAAGIGAWANS
jgi:hypothetical protein